MSIECPTCIGRMEFQILEGREVYRCPNCDHQEPAAMVHDARCWWGGAHLPLVDVVINPPAAFRQLRDHPALGAAIAFFFAGLLAQWRFMGKDLHAVWQKILPHFPSAVTGFWLYPLLAGAALATTLVQAASLHLVAQFVEVPFSKSERATFKPLWTLTLFLNAYFGLFQLAPLPRSLRWSLFAAHAVWYIWGLATLYDFSPARSFGVWLGSLFLNSLLGAGLGLTLFFVLLRHPGVSPKHMPGTDLQQVHRPADYGWQVKNLDGKAVPLKDLKGKVIFLNIWATWCMPCRLEMPGIQKLYDALKGNSQIVFMCVSEEGAKTVELFMKKTKYTFPVYVTQGPIPSAFASRAIPVTYILSPEGQIVAEHTGAGRWNTEANRRFLVDLTSSSTTVHSESS